MRTSYLSLFLKNCNIARQLRFLIQGTCPVVTELPISNASIKMVPQITRIEISELNINFPYNDSQLSFKVVFYSDIGLIDIKENSSQF